MAVQESAARADRLVGIRLSAGRSTGGSGAGRVVLVVDAKAAVAA